MFTELYHKNKIDLKTLISKMTCEPAKIFGLDAGTLSIDAPADVTIIDPELAWTVDAKNFYTKGSHSPFVGRELKGRVVATIVNGNLMKLNQW